MTRTRTLTLTAGVVLAVLAVLAIVVAVRLTGDGDAVVETVTVDTVIVELRVWQHVDDPEELLVASRLPGWDWESIKTVPLERTGRSTGYGEAYADVAVHHRMGRSAGYAESAIHHYNDHVIAGVELRVWQRAVEPERIFVQACARTCPDPGLPPDRYWPAWNPLGMNPLPLDAGHSEDGRYRYGDITIAVPRGNAELLAERERLLALRDVLEGGGTDLDWSLATPTASWEGVTVSGSPARVTALDLAGHGLAGEIWGYLSGLPELTELRLDGNALTGRIPSAMSVLSKLTDVYLGGNSLTGCIPPPLRRAANHDLDMLGLADCPNPVFGRDLPADAILLPGTYAAYLEFFSSPTITHAVFDVPDGAGLLVQVLCPRGLTASGRVPPPQSIFEDWDRFGVIFRDPGAPETTWLYIDGRRGYEWERSPYPYSSCLYDCGPHGSPAALIEQVAASVWFIPIANHDIWVWP